MTATKPTGLDAFHEAGNKLKSEVAQEHKAANQRAIEAAKLSPAALEYLNKHSTTGADDLNTGMSVPQLRVHSAGNSTKNQLVDGTDPADGQLYYTGTQEAFNKVTVILLSIKKCRLEQKDEKTGEISMKAHYLLAGVLEDSLKPFIIYVKGMSYNKVWDLEDQLKPYVTKRAGGIPLSMVKIVVGSDKERVEKGTYKGQLKNVLTFTLLMDVTNSYPILENDGDRLDMLERATETAEEMLMSIISQKGMTEKEWNEKKRSADVNYDIEADKADEPEATEVYDSIVANPVDDEDVPF